MKHRVMKLFYINYILATDENYVKLNKLIGIKKSTLLKHFAL